MHHALILATLLAVSPASATENDGWYPGKFWESPNHSRRRRTARIGTARGSDRASVRMPQPIIIYHLPPVLPEPPQPTWTDKVAKGWNVLKVCWDAGHILGPIGLLLLTWFGSRRRPLAKFSRR